MTVQHHPFLPMLHSPRRCASGRDGDSEKVCNLVRGMHAAPPPQNHKFYAGDPDHPGRCTMKDDYSEGICWELKMHHNPVIFTEINPHLETERTRLAGNLKQDMDAANTFAEQYRAWSQDERLDASARAQHESHRQVWEARAKALYDALRGLQGHTDD